MKQNNSFKTKLATLKWSWASLALAIVLLLINHKLIFGNAVGIWDADGQFLPYQILVSDFARQGKLLLWDCWTNAGIPTSGDPQVGAFSPINITIGLLFGGTSLGFIALWMFVWYLGGWGILMLGRHFKLPFWAAFVVALQFLFVGIYITNAEHTPWLVGFSFLPIIIWRLDVAIMAKSYFNAALAGAVWGLSALSAYPGFTIITGLFCFLWLLGSLFARNTFIGNFKKSVLQASLIFTCFTIVGLLVLSPTYFSFLYDAAGTTTRVGVLSKEAVLTVNPLHLGATATFASPLLAVQQLHNEQLYLGTDISMTSIYSGVLIFLALFSLVNNHKSKWHWYLLGLAFLMLGFALSNDLPLRGWLYDWFFPSKFFKHSALFRAYFLFASTVLALLGIKDLSEMLKNGYDKLVLRKFSISAYATIAAVMFTFFAATKTLANLGPDADLAYFQLAFVWLGVACLPFCFTRKFNHKATSLVPVLLLLIVLVDILCVYQISSPVMKSDTSDAVARWKNLNNKHSKDLDLNNPGFSRKESSCIGKSAPCVSLDNDQLIDKMPVFIAYSTQINRFHLAMNKHQALKSLAIGGERIWFSAAAAEILPTMDNFNFFENAASQSNGVPLVIHTEAAMLGAIQYCKTDSSLSKKLLNAPRLSKITTKLNNYSPTELKFEVNAPSNGWLLVTDRWARSWNAKVNNKQVKIYGANFIFRAIALKKGLQKIHFYYKPIAYPYLLVLSWGTLAVLLFISIRIRLKKRFNF